MRSETISLTPEVSNLPPVSQEARDVVVELDEGGDARQNDRPQTTVQDPPSEAVSQSSRLSNSYKDTDTQENQSDPTASNNSRGDSSELPVLRIRAGDTKITCAVLVLNLIT